MQTPFEIRYDPLPPTSWMSAVLAVNQPMPDLFLVRAPPPALRMLGWNSSTIYRKGRDADRQHP